MRLLLDTHVVLWLVLDDPKLGPVIRTTLEDGAGAVCVSVASLWEMAIKASLGKLVLPANLRETLIDSGVSILPIEARHVDALAGLPRHHNDPFDRMLIAQTKADGLTLVSADRTVSLYDVPVLWS